LPNSHVTKIQTFSQFVQLYIVHPKFLLRILSYAIGYSLLLLILINIRVLTNIVANFPNPLMSIKLSSMYLWRYLITLPPIDIILLIIIALLIGFNIQLISLKIKNITKQKNLRLTFGAGLLSIVGTGCATCGFSVLSVIGLGGIATLLPFGGIELSYITIVILSVSLWYNLKTMYAACKLRS
jgi:hypothetical protein